MVSRRKPRLSLYHNHISAFIKLVTPIIFHPFQKEIRGFVSCGRLLPSLIQLVILLIANKHENLSFSNQNEKTLWVFQKNCKSLEEIANSHDVVAFISKQRKCLNQWLFFRSIYQIFWQNDTKYNRHFFYFPCITMHIFLKNRYIFFSHCKKLI